jgi:hypothetical protein
MNSLYTKTNLLDSAILFYTARGLSKILREGGCGDWVLDPEHAREQRFAVVIQNRGPIERGDNWGKTTQSHGEAFLVGQICGVVSAKDSGRYRVLFDKCAIIDMANMWPVGLRNPVLYSSLSAHGIDLASLNFNITLNGGIYE